MLRMEINIGMEAPSMLTPVIVPSDIVLISNCAADQAIPTPQSMDVFRLEFR